MSQAQLFVMNDVKIDSSIFVRTSDYNCCRQVISDYWQFFLYIVANYKTSYQIMSTRHYVLSTMYPFVYNKESNIAKVIELRYQNRLSYFNVFRQVIIGYIINRLFTGTSYKSLYFLMLLVDRLITYLNSEKV